MQKKTAPEPITYNIPSSAELEAMGKERPPGAFLDPNHTHFILVDDGSAGMYGTEIELRTRLEGAIAEESQLSDGTLLVTLELVPFDHTLKQGCPEGYAYYNKSKICKQFFDKDYINISTKS